MWVQVQATSSPEISSSMRTGAATGLSTSAASAPGAASAAAARAAASADAPALLAAQAASAGAVVLPQGAAGAAGSWLGGAFSQGLQGRCLCARALLGKCGRSSRVH